MPLVQDSPFVTSYLVHEAPVNDKTREIRKMFDVDEKTGYPRQYNWRSVAKLGADFPPEDVFTKLTPYAPEMYYSTKATAVLVTGALCGTVGVVFNIWRGRPWWAAPYTWMSTWAAMLYGMNWAGEKTMEHAGVKNQIYLDYVKKHPERFGMMHRPKVREVVFPYIPVRC